MQSAKYICPSIYSYRQLIYDDYDYNTGLRQHEKPVHPFNYIYIATIIDHVAIHIGYMIYATTVHKATLRYNNYIKHVH